MTCPSMLSARKSENSGGCKSSQGIGTDLKFEERTLERDHWQSSAANQTTTLSKKKRRYINAKSSARKTGKERELNMIVKKTKRKHSQEKSLSVTRKGENKPT